MSYPLPQAGESEADIMARVLSGQLARIAAARELGDMGVTSASPADVEAWLTMTPQQKRRLTLAWLVHQASYAGR